MNQVPHTILTQLGGNKFLAMTGARNLVGGENYLSMSLPRAFYCGHQRVSHVTVTLRGDDTYTVEAKRFRPQRSDFVSIASAEQVYCDNLRAIFTEMTGLYTSLRG